MGLGSPSAALWGTITSLISPKPEQEPGSFFSCMERRGMACCVLVATLVQRVAPMHKKGSQGGMAKPPESAMRMSVGTVMREKRDVGWVWSENATRSGKTCRFYEAPIPELV